MTKVHQPADDSPRFTPAVLYGAKSTQDKHRSIPTQLAEGREMAQARGWTVVGEFSDEGFSAYSGNRGPDLEAAKRCAAQAAAEHARTAMLIAQAHDRFARGAGDRPGAPQSLGELWHEMRRRDVWLRTVEDDEELRDEASVAAIGRRAHIDSQRKSRSVQKGMARRKALGLHNGRPAFGYLSDGGRLFAQIADAEVVRRIFREWVGGSTQYAITQRLNQDHVPTQRGGEWTQGTVSKILGNPAYAGLDLDGEPCRCGHEGLVSCETWEHAQALRGGRHNVGGPNRRTAAGHLFLNGFLRCGICGSALGPRTGRTRGSETYKCQRVRNHGAGACTMPPVRREPLEHAVVQHFLNARLDVKAMRKRHAETMERRLAEVVARRRDAEIAAMRAADRLERVKRWFQDGALNADDWREQRDELIGEEQAATAQARQLHEREDELKATVSARDTEAEVLRFLATVRESMLAPVRDAASLDALRAGFRRIYRSFHVYPAGSTEAVALAGEAGERLLVVAPTSADGVFLGPAYRDLKVALPVPANSDAASLVT